MRCPGCDEEKPIEEFNLTQKVDRQCKKYLDRIYHQCKVQGKVEWFTSQRSTEKGTKAMLDYYRKLLSACTLSTPKFTVAQYMEQERSEQEVEYGGLGELMWEVEAIEFWMTTKGGAMSRDDAKHKWDSWAANYTEWGILSDMQSPNPKFPLRLRIPTKDTIDFKSRVVDSKLICKSETGIKKPKEADLEKLNARLLTGFEKHGNASNDSRRLELAQQMVSAGAGQAFSDVGVLLSDITVLGSDEKKAEADEEQAAPPSAVPGAPTSPRSSVSSLVGPFAIGDRAIFGSRTTGKMCKHIW